MVNPRLLQNVLLASMLLLAACSGEDDPAPAPPPPPNRFAAIDALVDAHRTQRNLPGVGIAIYNNGGTKVHEYMSGTLTGDTRLPIASASKLVSGVTLFRLIDAGYLSLDTTAGAILGWQADKAGITLRHMLSFTTGLEPDPACSYLPNLTLTQCVSLIAGMPMIAAPGTRFDYGSAHLAAAVAMAELQLGQNWNAIFQARLAQPLGIAVDAIYYANPVTAEGPNNPLPAGGLNMSMNDYARVLRVVFDRGMRNGSSFISAALFDEQARLPFPLAVVGNSPPAVGGGYRYGLTAWLECSTPETGCNRISSPGAFGFTPWVDRDAGYYAVLGMYDPGAGAAGASVALEQTLQPMIVTALAP